MILFLFKRIRSWLGAPGAGNASADDAAFFPDLAARFASCTCRSDLESAVAGSFRSCLGLQAVSLYLAGSSGTFAAVNRGSRHPHFPASSALLVYFLSRNRAWNPAGNEYAPAEEEREFVRAAGVRWIVPLVTGRQVFGLVVLAGDKGKQERTFTARDFAVINLIASQAAPAAANLNLTDELCEMRELAGMARMSSFVIHDIKNLTHALSLMIDNAGEHMADPAFQRDLITSLRQTEEKMKALSQRLQGIPGIVSPRRQLMDIRFLCQTVIEEFRKTRPGVRIVIRGEAVYCLVEGEEIRKVVVNLLQNALDAIGPHGLIRVETGMRARKACLTIADTGCGMTPDFINDQLFRPFRSTKKTGMGIGLYQCRQIVQSLGGSITVMSERGKGTTFTIYLPAAEPKPVTIA